MEADRSETVNLMYKMPVEAQEIEQMWKVWAGKSKVLPWSEVKKKKQ